MRFLLLLASLKGMPNRELVSGCFLIPALCFYFCSYPEGYTGGAENGTDCRPIPYLHQPRMRPSTNPFHCCPSLAARTWFRWSTYFSTASRDSNPY